MPEWFPYAAALLTTLAAAAALWSAFKTQRSVAALRDELQSKFHAISAGADIEDPISVGPADPDDSELEDR